ncbi:hypothetical protein [Paucisalibacillus sp. EB02]|uniref:hypothetical protein n=1 Tax=Paucisalibacillus sp. EB02 TaxID=1347087 RepID=UPI0004B548F2|nr:hypothetical protein [Paucisalibacillus sp. EB02]
MKRLFVFIVAICFVLVACGQGPTEEKSNSTRDRVYSESWDGNPIIVEQRSTDGDYKIINEITDTDAVNKLIDALGNAAWEENVKVDIGPPDYSFTWNSYEHSVWVNEEYERLELIINGQSNYGTLSKSPSELVFGILTGEKF